ncbi:MAG: FHIPEP family type III secretion protein [Planctomycetes bacterium]|nr:FHIPEP family type III secretion protein [Planctomycetota bacterium]
MTNPDRSQALLGRFGEIALSLAVVAIVAALVVEMPPGLLDALLATNIAAGVLVLLVALSIPDAAKLPSFPTILLLTTLFRLALSVGSTRLILSQGSAGEVISALGSAASGGGAIVGAVVFVVLVFVQFVVIAKGSERVAEVAARFSLDAMPGKQMSIDADLRAGQLTPDAARAARSALERESRLYGAMDGAMKFVKGDAIAGMFIALVNFAGGVAVTYWKSRGAAAAPFADIAEKFGLLTIGNGLAAQIPSILVSVAAGLIVTRVGAAEGEQPRPAARDIADQIFSHPRALILTAVLLLALALLPSGLPALPFIALAAIAFALSARAAWNKRRDARAAGDAAHSPARGEVPTVSVRLHPSLAGDLTLERQSLSDRVQTWREAMCAEFGLPSLAAVISTDDSLSDASYAIDVAGVPAAFGSVPKGQAILRADSAKVLGGGFAATALGALWSDSPLCTIPISQAGAAASQGLATMSPADAIARHLDWAVRRKAPALLGIQEVAGMIESLRASRPELVRAATPNPLSLQQITDVLRRLLKERVPIRPLPVIIESLARHGQTTKSPHLLAERVRRDLADALCARFAASPGKLSFYAADPDLENLVAGGAEETSEGQAVTLSHDDQRRVVESLRRAIDPRRHEGKAPVVIVSGFARRALRTIIEDSLPTVAVLSYDELSRDVELERLGLVVLEPA